MKILKQIGRLGYALLNGFLPASFFFLGYVYAASRNKINGFMWDFMFLLIFILYPLSFLGKIIIDIVIEHKKGALK
jgi:hypothetical protein